MSAESEKVRSSAVLWTVLNVVAFFLGNLLAAVGIVLAAIAIGKAQQDVEGARTLVRWSWVLFAVGFAIAALVVIAVVLFLVIGTVGAAGGF